MNIIVSRLLAPATIFLGALLLFEVEPLIAKMILPWFGGSAAVWIACLLFFQTALLAGYLYAHVVATRLSPLWQARLHTGLLIASLVFLPIVPSAYWRPTGTENPLPLILGLLTGTIGLPFILLSSTTPLVQAWIAGHEATSGRIYRLYALSNLGSMLALLSYPTLVEPLLPTHWQAQTWSGLYVAFAVLCMNVAWRFGRHAVVTATADNGGEPSPSGIDRVLWVVLPLAASALLLALTDHILRNVAAIPLLWVVPLALYLLSFIVTFESPRCYFRPLWYTLAGAFVAVTLFVLVGLFLENHLLALVSYYAIGLFVCCTVCHGELASLKPSSRHLTAYYLSISAGGAIGGLLVAAVAPAVLNATLDLAILLPLVAALIIFVAMRRWPDTVEPAWRWLSLAFLLAILAIDTTYMAQQEIEDLAIARVLERNFYGALRVWDSNNARVLQNGNVVHGRESLVPNLEREPASYYSRVSGVGLAIGVKELQGPVNLGIIGLGTGTVAAYGRAGDSYKYYEINPAVRDIARRDFRYLTLSGAKGNIVIGDARLSLEREAPQNFDVLAIDAFTSDSIPVHLLTREAFALYWRHLKPDGVLAVHVSNKYVDLGPVTAAAAAAMGKTARVIGNLDDAQNNIDASTWVLVANDPAFFESPSFLNAAMIPVPKGFRVWTDDFSNLWNSLRWNDSN